MRSTRSRASLKPAVVCTVSALAVAGCKGAETVSPVTTTAEASIAQTSTAAASTAPSGTSSTAPTGAPRAPPISVAHKKRKKHHDPGPWDFKSPKVDFASAAPQNATDGDDRLIFAMGDACKVEVPPSGPMPHLPPGFAPHAYEDVDCPADYDDEAWDDCTYIITRDKSGCYCLPNGGNPPPPPKSTACPKLERKRS